MLCQARAAKGQSRNKAPCAAPRPSAELTSHRGPTLAPDTLPPSLLPLAWMGNGSHRPKQPPQYNQGRSLDQNSHTLSSVHPPYPFLSSANHVIFQGLP